MYFTGYGKCYKTASNSLQEENKFLAISSENVLQDTKEMKFWIKLTRAWVSSLKAILILRFLLHLNLEQKKMT